RPKSPSVGSPARPKSSVGSPARPKSPSVGSPARAKSLGLSPRPKSPSPGSPRPIPGRTPVPKRGLLSPSSSEGRTDSPSKRALCQEIEIKQKELDRLKRQLEEEQVKAEKREDEMSHLQRDRQSVWASQLDQQRREWLPMSVEDERGRLLRQVSLIVAQTCSSLSARRAQVMTSFERLERENKVLRQQVESLEQQMSLREEGRLGFAKELLQLRLQEEEAARQERRVRSELQSQLQADQEAQELLGLERQKTLDLQKGMELWRQEADSAKQKASDLRSQLQQLEQEGDAALRSERRRSQELRVELQRLQDSASQEEEAQDLRVEIQRLRGEAERGQRLQSELRELREVQDGDLATQKQQAAQAQRHAQEEAQLAQVALEDQHEARAALLAERQQGQELLAQLRLTRQQAQAASHALERVQHKASQRLREPEAQRLLLFYSFEAWHCHCLQNVLQ
ncbi:unnamed protein product, partial [Effrenium voratum]